MKRDNVINTQHRLGHRARSHRMLAISNPFVEILLLLFYSPFIFPPPHPSERGPCQALYPGPVLYKALHVPTTRNRNLTKEGLATLPLSLRAWHSACNQHLPGPREPLFHILVLDTKGNCFSVSWRFQVCAAVDKWNGCCFKQQEDLSNGNFFRKDKKKQTNLSIWILSFWKLNPKDSGMMSFCKGAEPRLQLRAYLYAQAVTVLKQTGFRQDVRCGRK